MIHQTRTRSSAPQSSSDLHVPPAVHRVQYGHSVWTVATQQAVISSLHYSSSSVGSNQTDYPLLLMCLTEPWAHMALLLVHRSSILELLLAPDLLFWRCHLAIMIRPVSESLRSLCLTTFHYTHYTLHT